ncbi:MAG: adenine phosphoribosyltransferase [Alphaproteobacteria bacterium]|nr:adenine phosphoribosyltransferase [Alphaproteobacteria bacterium]
MTIQDIKNSIRNVPDFPKSGIQFKDITTAIKQPQILQEIITTIAAQYQNQHIDYVVGIESRGFIFGAALAYALKCGFVPIRKPNKLPAQTISQEYALEYGTDKLEIHTDAIAEASKVLIIDDLLATGGTAAAAAKLVQRLHANIVGFAFIIELTALQGSKSLQQYADVYSLLKY